MNLKTAGPRPLSLSDSNNKRLPTTKGNGDLGNTLGVLCVLRDTAGPAESRRAQRCDHLFDDLSVDKVAVCTLSTKFMFDAQRR